jgi:hypothetical protein
MTTWGISVIRNAADVVGPVVAHMQAQTDQVLVLDNGSTDGTYELLQDAGVVLLRDDTPAFRQGDMMTDLAARAAGAGAEWVVPFDADEWWYSPHHPTISEHLDSLDRYSVAKARLFDHVTTDLDNLSNPNPVTRIGWRRRRPGPMGKVAARCLPGLRIADGNHSADYSGVLRARVARNQLVVRHFPYRSAEQFVRKARMGAAGLRAAGLPEHVGKHWRDYDALAEAQGEDVLAGVYLEHFHATDPLNRDDLIYDPAP